MNEGKFIELLNKELVIAMGCTEPLALAYAGSIARHYLGEKPKKVILNTSINIFKNVRCVSLPNKTELKGVKASTLLGILAGDYTKGFSCIEGLDNSYDKEIKDYIDNDLIEVEYLNYPEKLYINLTVIGDKKVSVEIKNHHLEVTKIIVDGEVILNKVYDSKEIDYSDYLSFKDIYDFSKNVDLDKVRNLISLQYKYNLEISEFGLTSKQGVMIGSTILKANPTVWGKVKAYTASGSEARMCGSLMPVIINSGSGNQGLSSSVPVIVYGRERKYSLDEIYRALIFTNLLTIKQKVGIGDLSAYCGIVASCGSSGAGFTYLDGGTYEQLIMTMKNYLANVPGIICDGAKASCAAKIATALDGAILAHQLAMDNKQYPDGSGIIKEDIDETIKVITEIASKGMQETDTSIIKNLLL